MTKAKELTKEVITGKKLYVECEDRTFNLSLPEGVKITYGPWALPAMSKAASVYHEPNKARGTLRVYQGSKDNIIALFTGVTSFRQSDVVVEDDFPIINNITVEGVYTTPGQYADPLYNIKSPW